MPLRRFLLFLLLATIPFITPPSASAACDPPSCPNGWDCSMHTDCCQCDHGANGGEQSGPVTCCTPPNMNVCEPTHDVYGCNPAPTSVPPTNTPIPPTPTSIPATIPPPAPTNSVPMDNFAPLKYPCRRTTTPDNSITFPEFHPLRPYPGSPCDPLIPRKVPEAPASTNPDKMYLTYYCGKSMNVSGVDINLNVVPICGTPVLPSPIPTPYDNLPGMSDPEWQSIYYRCDNTSTDICFVKKVIWDLQFDLSPSQLPIMGNTEINYTDVLKVNGYLSWYLNGTIYQAEQLPLNGFDPTDQKRITTYSGPLNKLLPKLWSDDLKHTVYSNYVGTDFYKNYHNYLVACQKNLDLLQIIQDVAAIFRMIGIEAQMALRLAGIFIHAGIQNIGEIAQALGEIASAINNGQINLPPSAPDLHYAAQIFINHGLAVIGNDANAIIDILSLRVDLIAQMSTQLDILSLDFIEACSTSPNVRRLSYMAAHNWQRGMPYVPFSTLEDTTGEVTVSLIPANQPTDIDGTILSMQLRIDAPSDSRLYFAHLRAALALSEILSGTYRPIMTPTPAVSSKNVGLVSQNINQHQGRPPVPGAANDVNVQIAREYPNSTQITRNTEVRENAPAPTPLYNADPLCDLVKTRTNRGDTLKPGPRTTNKAINATLTYWQLMRFTPRLVIECAPPAVCPVPNGTGNYCVNDPCKWRGEVCSLTNPNQCCTDELHGGYGGTEGNCPFQSDCVSADADFQCIPPSQEFECQNNPTQNHYWQHYNQYSCTRRDGSQYDFYCCGPQEAPVYHDYCGPRPLCDYYGLNCSYCASLDQPNCNVNQWCEWHHDVVYGGHTIQPNPPFCPAWPTVNLRSAARTNVFTKTPLVEKLYDLLVYQPQSLLRRWLPLLPLSATSASDLKTGKNNTIPASTSVRYMGSTDQLYNPQVTAGRGGSGALYFPELGSLSDYLLGSPNGENLNLQRLLRPKGFIGPVGMEPGASGDANCNTNLPEQSANCIEKNHYIDATSRWYPPGTDQGQPNAVKCFNDVVYRANAAGVNPDLALVAWANECDTSNYARVGSCWDFGVVSQPQNDFSAQLDAYLRHISTIRNDCAGYIGRVDPVEIYASRYITYYCTLSDVQAHDPTHLQEVKDYIKTMNDDWAMLDGGCAFPFP